jgi:HSP20 family protein
MFWDEEDFLDRSKKRRRFPLLWDRFFEDIDKMIEQMFKDFSGNLPGDLVRERKRPDGSISRTIGPFIYGYSVTFDSKGKPVIRQFRNVRHSVEQTHRSLLRPGLEFKGERDPLVDVMDEGDVIRVIAELPSVEKSDISLNVSDNSLTISVNKPGRKYYREIELNSEISPISSKATFKNGVLEVVLTKVKTKVQRKCIRVE